MEKRRQFSHKRFLIIYIAVYFHLQDAGGYQLNSAKQAMHSYFLPKSTIWRVGGRVTLWKKNLTNTPQSGDKVNVKSDSHTDNRYPWCIIRMTLFLRSLSKIHNLHVIMGKTGDKCHFNGLCKIHDQHSLQLSRLSETMKVRKVVTSNWNLEMWWLNALWYCEWGSGTRKDSR